MIFLFPLTDECLKRYALGYYYVYWFHRLSHWGLNYNRKVNQQSRQQRTTSDLQLLANHTRKKVAIGNKMTIPSKTKKRPSITGWKFSPANYNCGTKNKWLSQNEQQANHHCKIQGELLSHDEWPMSYNRRTGSGSPSQAQDELLSHGERQTNHNCKMQGESPSRDEEQVSHHRETQGGSQSQD